MIPANEQIGRCQIPCLTKQLSILFPEHQDLVFHRFGVNALQLYLLRYCQGVHKHLSLGTIQDIRWRRKSQWHCFGAILGFLGPWNMGLYHEDMLHL